MEALTFNYIVAAWFLFSLIFDRKTRLSATFLFVSFFVNIIFVDVYDVFEHLSYQEMLWSLVLYDGVLALSLAYLCRLNKAVLYHVLISCATIICHSMISLYLLTDNEALELMTLLFYRHYDALLLITAGLHLMVSLDGIVRAIDRFYRLLQSVFGRGAIYYGCFHKALFIRTKRETKK